MWYFYAFQAHVSYIDGITLNPFLLDLWTSQMLLWSAGDYISSFWLSLVLVVTLVVFEDLLLSFQTMMLLYLASSISSWVESFPSEMSCVAEHLLKSIVFPLRKPASQFHH